jgi:hypothetical protein
MNEKVFLLWDLWILRCFASIENISFDETACGLSTS